MIDNIFFLGKWISSFPGKGGKNLYIDTSPSNWSNGHWSFFFFEHQKNAPGSKCRFLEDICFKGTMIHPVVLWDI